MGYDPGAPYAQPVPQRRREGAGTGLAVGALILAVCAFIGLVLAAVLGAAAVIGLYGENEKLRSEMKDLRETVEYVNDSATRLWIATDMRLLGVTEEFYTDDVVFYADDVVALNVMVQPDFDDHYEGNGRFDVSGDELKGKLGDYVREFERCYDNGKRAGMTAFKDLELQISVYGYDVATYKGGELTLE